MSHDVNIMKSLNSLKKQINFHKKEKQTLNPNFIVFQPLDLRRFQIQKACIFHPEICNKISFIEKKKKKQSLKWLNKMRQSF